MALKLSNNAVSTLAASITSGATTLSVQGGDAGKFPVLGVGDWHPATIIDSANNMEIVRVTARAGATLTIARAQEGTTAKAFAAGSRIDVRLTAETVASIVQKINDDVATLNSAIAQRVQKSGDTMTGALTAAGYNITGSVGTNRNIIWTTAGSPRWSTYADASPESGANAGSNLAFARFSDAGIYIDNPVIINRSSGDVGLTKSLSVAGSVYVDGETVSRNVNSFRTVYNNYGVFWRFDGGSHYLMFTNSGDQYGTYNSLRPFIVSATSGNVTLGHDVNVVGTLTMGNKATPADIAAGTANKFPDAAAVGTKRPAVITPSGSAFTLNIPAEAQRLTLKFAGIQTNAASMYICRLGTSGGILTTGYVARATGYQGNAMNCTVASAYFPLIDAVQADHGSVPTYGFLELKRVARGSNKWVITGDITRGSSGMCDFQGGIELASELTQLQISTAAGTATFSGGNSVAIEWEF